MAGANQLPDSAIAAQAAPEQKSATTRRRAVMVVSTAIGAALVLWVLIDANSMSAAANAVKLFIMSHFGRPLMVLNTLIVLVGLFLLVSPLGRIKLGPDDAKPAFGTFSWLFTMFAASVGAGIVYWATAEPFFYQASGQFFVPGAEDGERARILAAVMFGNGIHAWACYAVMGVTIGYFACRKAQSPSFSSASEEVFKGWMPARAASAGAGIGDCLAVFGMLFGIGGSIAAGVLQISSGLGNILHPGIAGSAGLAMLVLAIVISISLASSLSGAHRGLALASNINILLALGLLLFILFAGGPTLLLGRFAETVAYYPAAIWDITQRTFTGTDGFRDWLWDWPLTYFLWTMSWSPFVGAFIAEVSKGRTIRQTLLGTLVFQTFCAIFWFSIVGGWAMEADDLSGHQIAARVLEDVSAGIFYSLEALPNSNITQLVAIALAGIFLITTCAAGILVLGIMTTGNDKPARAHQVFWAIVLATVATMVVLTNTLQIIRAAPVFAALPITLLGSATIVALLLNLRRDGRRSRKDLS